MKYTLTSLHQANAAFQYLTDLVGRDATVEIKKVEAGRSLNQNSYIHMLLGAFGSHFGYTIAESKLIYKELSRDIYAYDKKGRTFWRSSADLSIEEMTKSIDRFREKSAEQGFPLPTAVDEGWITQLENDAEHNSKYL